MYELVVVGGGPVGACLGALLARGTGGAPLPVALLEPHPPSAPAADAPLESRVVALSRASERLLKRAGAWEAIAGPRMCAYERMRIWHESVTPQGDAVLQFDAAEVGEPNLGYIVENRLLQAALLEAFVRAGGHLERAALVSLGFGSEGVSVRTSQGELTGRLVVGADGARSVLRSAAALAADTRAYGQTAIVATVATERPHRRTAWQRFMKDGTLALLPLADGHCSIVWSADDELGVRLLALEPQAFAAELDRASDHVLGATRLVSERVSFPLAGLSAHRYVAERVALIGDAAHVVHPLAGQGVNLGLLDAAALAQQVTDGVARGEDPGALAVLRPYERWRKSEAALMSAAIDAFDRLLAHGSGPASQLARRALGWVNRAPELQRFFIRRALGVSGELPRAAR
jgi:2-polyprenylphenol 6-hydroxylase